MANRKVVLIMSGGLDSTCLLWRLLHHKHEIKALSFDYDQRHSIELDYAEKLAAKAGVPWACVNLESLGELLPGSSQTDSKVDVPEGHYAAENMKKTVVPNRNMIMLSIAAGHAIALKYDWVAFAAHSGDHTIYPDCRPEFHGAMNDVLAKCDWHRVILQAPYIGLTKAQVLQDGRSMGAPIGETWSCYKGLEKHCGKCGACTERKEAFSESRIPDPTEYLA